MRAGLEGGDRNKVRNELFKNYLFLCLWGLAAFYLYDVLYLLSKQVLTFVSIFIFTICNIFLIEQWSPSTFKVP